MDNTMTSDQSIENNTIVDEAGNITVDFTNELLPMTINSTITVKVGTMEYVMKPIATISYYKFNDMVEEAENNKEIERRARSWLVSSCLVKPKMTDEEMYHQPIGLNFLLFNVLMQKSFLLKTD